MNKFSFLKCFFRFHKYEIYKEEDVVNSRGNIIGKTIISRCVHCGNIKKDYIELIKYM